MCVKLESLFKRIRTKEMISRNVLKCLLRARRSLNVSTTIRFSHLDREGKNINVAIIGSGPSGFYTAQYLLKNPNVKVDIYEKSPVPFGLIRFGVAPDHQDVKNVVHSFTTTGNNHRVSFYGNVSIGSDISLSQLRQAYHAVILCYGAAEDRLLHIDGEKIPNVLPARRFVGWYNGVPSDSHLSVNLNTENVVIIGQGNVALDCARILLSPAEFFMQKTDITSHALNCLKESKVKNVYIVGRRGYLQVSFTIKEFRELTKIANCQTLVPLNEFTPLLPNFLQSLPRPRRRLTEFLIKISKENKIQTDKKCRLKFLRSPLKINGNNETGVKSVTFGLNQLSSDENLDNVICSPTGEEEVIDCGLVLRSIGYKAVAIDPDIPIDDKTGVIANKDGRVTVPEPGLYCSGWAATGATGVILSTMNASFEVAKNILTDIDSNKLGINDEKKLLGSKAILDYFKYKNINYVTFKDWEKVDEYEQNLGKQLGKLREKVIETSDILKIVKS